MSTSSKLVLATGLSLLIPGAADAQFYYRGRGVCPWGMHIIQQQQQSSMMWNYRNQQQQTQMTAQVRQRQQYKNIQKTIQPGPTRRVVGQPYQRVGGPQITKRQVPQPIVRRLVTETMVRRQVVQEHQQTRERTRMVAIWQHTSGREQGPSRAELLLMLAKERRQAKWHTATHVDKMIRKEDTRVANVSRQQQEVKRNGPVHEPPHQLREGSQPQQQNQVRCKTVADLQVALKVQKKTVADSGVVKMNRNITVLDIQCVRCHQKMHIQMGPPLMAGPKAHPPLHKPLAKAPPPLHNPLAKGPVPFKNPLAKGPVPFKNPLARDPVPFKNPLAKNMVPFRNPLAKDFVPFRNPLAKDFVPFRNPLAKDFVPFRNPLVNAPEVPLQLGIPKEPRLMLNQPMIPQPKPAPLAFANLPPPALVLAIPAPTNQTNNRRDRSLPTPVADSKPANLTSPWQPGPNPFAGSGPGLVLPAMLGNVPGQPAFSQPGMPNTQTPSAGLPGDGLVDLPAGMTKQPSKDSEASEQSIYGTPTKDLLQPDFPPLPPGVLLLRPRTPRTQDAGPDFSPVRWIADHTPPVTGNRGG